MRILLAGDWHGDIMHAKYCVETAYQYDCDYLVQLGDFGYWEHVERGPDYLTALSEFVEQSGIPIWWIDGNHENHDMLRANYDTSGLCEMRPGLTYIPRGTTWEWDGVKFMGFGGAYSIDKAARTKGYDWFAAEMPSDEEIAYAASQGHVDILLTHDVPNGIDMAYQMSKQGRRYGVGIYGADLARKKIREVVDAAEPKAIFHGHYHLRYTEKLFTDYAGPRGIPVTGLAHNWTDIPMDSITVIDTKDYR